MHQVTAVFAARDRCDETVERLRSVRTDRFLYIRNFHPQRPHLQPNAYKDGKTIVQTLRALHDAGRAVVCETLPSDYGHDAFLVDVGEQTEIVRGFLAKCLRELAPHKVRVNGVAPGVIDTEMSKDVREMAGDEVKARILHSAVGGINESDVILASEKGEVGIHLAEHAFALLAHRGRRQRPAPGRAEVFEGDGEEQREQ